VTSPNRLVGSTAALLIIGFAALLAIVGTTFWLGERSQVIFERVIAARDTRGAAAELRHAVQTAETSQRGYLFTGNQIYLAPYGTAKTLAGRSLDALGERLAAIPNTDAAYARLKAVVEEKIKEMDQTIALKRIRRDAEALAVFRTNRGKALMDEANVFLSSFMRAADERLTEGVAEQNENAALLRLVSIIGGTLIVLVVGVVLWALLGYTRDLRRARDEVAALNASLEKRVEDRTADLKRERDRAEVLLAEVNHRVANSLALVGSMVSLQAKAADSETARALLAETQGRIYAVSLLHKRLYTSGDVRFVDLDAYLAGLLANLEASMQSAGTRASLHQKLEPLKLATDKSVNLGVVATEWVTNAFKYAYPEKPGEIRVTLRKAEEGGVELTVEDDGVGRGDTQTAKGTGLGTKLVNAMAQSMGGRVEYRDRQPGTSARLVLPAAAA
jgi:two-component sensor histidine kinase/CHASE3 domain sensor protein